ncbi:MAG: ABC transporter permease [Actinomycetota bacterium]|nr:ABC transporter permease [Actinomycetota bacterium]
MNVRTTTLVARREIREQLRSKTLWISTVVTVIAVALLVVVPTLVKSGPPTYRVDVVGPATPTVSGAITSAGQAFGAHVHIATVPDRAAAEVALKNKGGTTPDLAVLTGPSMRVLVDQASPSGSTSNKTLFVAAVAQSVSSAQAIDRSGLTIAQARALTGPNPLPVDHLRPAPSSKGKRAAALVGSVLLFFLVLRWGVGLLIGVVQEKSSRVIEVILPAVRPVELLAGKVAGYGLLVFAQGAALALTALIAAGATGSHILAGSGAGTIVVAFVWLVLGFFFYAALYAGAGSLASKSEDAQSVGFPLQIPLFVGYLTAFTALGSGSPNGLVKILAYLPPTAPMDMPVLSASGGAGTLDVVISMLITAAGAVVAMRIGATIFSRSILRTGKRLKASEVLRERRSTRPLPATIGSARK